MASKVIFTSGFFSSFALRFLIFPIRLQRSFFYSLLNVIWQCIKGNLFESGECNQSLASFLTVFFFFTIAIFTELYRSRIQKNK